MESISLFEKERKQPLAAYLRPTRLDEFIGQSHLLGEGKLLRKMIENDEISSMIFWGPPGVGKTTLANIIAHQTSSRFINFSAVTSGIKEIKEVMQKAENNVGLGIRTILFIDEIHRFNKAQQDAFLPYVEKGSIVLIGATTENPSFEINNALLSRCRVFVLKALNEDEIVILLKRAINSDFFKAQIEIEEETLKLIANFSNGDARSALSTLDLAVTNGEAGNDHIIVTKELLAELTEKRSFLYDRAGEEHYNLISALHKSMRNSDPDAAVYWLARMLEAGEDPLYIARRLIRFSAEDIGMADPRALNIAKDSYDACHYLGMPECNVVLAEAVIYLSLAPKSNRTTVAYERAAKDANESINEPVPLHLRNAETKLMEDLNYGKGYKYAHDYENKVTAMQCLPDNLKDRHYYEPGKEGLEAKKSEQLAFLRNWKAGQKD